MQRYQEKKSLFDVPESDGTSLSPVTAAVYSFLTMIIVLQVTVLSAIGQSPYLSDENLKSSWSAKNLLQILHLGEEFSCDASG